MKYLNYALIIILVIFATLGIYFAYITVFPNNQSNQQQINVVIDETAILEKIKNISELKTIQMTFQRDIEIELDLGNVTLPLTNIVIGETKRTQSIAVTGTVEAGVDLSELNEDRVTVNGQDNTVAIVLPPAKILNVSIDEDKTRTLNDNFSLFFRLQNLDQNRERQLNEELFDQVIKQSRNALVISACEANILDTAATNAQADINNLFLLANDINNITITSDPAQECKF
jgi:hypothetical protein